MNTTDAKAYVRVINHQRNTAREIMMNEIMSLSAKMNKNGYSHTEMQVWGDVRLCLVLETLESMYEEQQALAKRNDKLQSQGMNRAY